MQSIFELPEWYDEAACHPDVWRGRLDKPDFFPGQGVSATRARALCNRCPVAEECLAMALRLPWLQGIWAGTTEKQRLAIKRKRASMAA